LINNLGVPKVMNRVALVLGTFWLAAGGSAAWGVPSVYDGFNYANDGSPLNGQVGGYGWAGPWNETGPAGNTSFEFTLSQTETSLDLPMLPFEPAGDRVLAAGPADGSGNTHRISRPTAGSFDLGADGTFFASFLMLKSGSASTGSDNQELVLLSGTSQTIRLGSTSTDLFWLGVSSNTFDPVTFGSTYFVVLRVESVASGSDTLSMSVFDATESVPLTEPVSYDRTHTFSSTATINGVQFWIGTNASGAYDEVRLGSTWADVTSINPNFTLGDFNLMDGITTADYHILRDNLYTGTTYEQGDMNFSGLVDLTDFALFREAYQNLGFSVADLDGPSVPEPAAAVLLGVAGVVFAASARRRGNAKWARTH
jgi:hypothetical protein